MEGFSVRRKASLDGDESVARLESDAQVAQRYVERCSVVEHKCYVNLAKMYCNHFFVTLI